MIRKSLIAVPLSLSLLLAGCGSEQAPTPVPTASASTEAPTPEPAPTVALSHDELVLSTIEVDLPGAGPPGVTLPGAITLEEGASRVLEEGSGEVVQVGSIVTARAVTFDGATGAEVPGFAFWDVPLTLSLTSTAPAIGDRLIGLAEGSTVLIGYVAPGGDVHVSVFVLDDVKPPSAWGAPVEAVPGLPTVTASVSGEPTLSGVQGYQPGGVVVQELLAGDGGLVSAGQTVDVQILTQSTASATPTSSTWATGPISLTLAPQEILPAVLDAIVGHRVGSRLLVAVPDAYGEANPDVAGSGEDFVYLIDLLAAV